MNISRKLSLKLLAAFAVFAVTSIPCNAEPAATVPVKFPVHKEVVPQALSVSIYSHTLPGASKLPAWSYVTEGLAKFEQPELILTVVRQDKESEADYSRDPLDFFGSALELAKRGEPLTVGRNNRFGAQGVSFLATQFTGVITLPSEVFEGVPAPKGALAVVPVTTEELDACDIGGAGRVGAALSRQARYYPFPTWCDRTRASAYTKGEIEVMQMEPVSKAPTASLYGAGVIADGAKLSLSVPKIAQDRLTQLLKDMPKDSMVRLNLSPDPRGNAFLAWGVQSPSAIAATGSDASIMSGSFVEFMPGMPQNQFAQYKDGYIIMLSNEDWTKLQASFQSHTNISFSGSATAELKNFEVVF